MTSKDSKTTPLPPVGRHTEALETQRGRTRESSNTGSTRTREPRRSSKPASQSVDKTSPEVAVPDLKKPKLEVEIKPD